MNIREHTENLEIKQLSPYAAHSMHSRGRERQEEQCEVRTCYQRDRDRIIHCKAFRRLKHKTQVFISPLGDHYRTRLTHTLEVSQIARTIAKALRLNEDLTEAIALGHDLGHTPFGHAGEEAINEIYKPGFKHNQQSLRIIEFLEERTGLNLTYEVRDGILNHTGPDKPITLEGQIVKIADRIAYINHDIDDALRAGIINMEELPQDCLDVLGRKHQQRIHAMVMDMIKTSWEQPEIKMSPEVKEAMDILRSYMYKNIYVGSAAKKEEEKAKKVLERLYYYFCENFRELPTEHLARIEKMGMERVVVDYIAGMTDRYALKVYEQKFLPVPWLLT